MPEYLHPGVYVQELKPIVRPIEGVSTSTAAFIGVAERGPVGKATLVTSFAEYAREFGGFVTDSFLTYAVQHFFDNGGRKCYIVRVAVGAKPASITLADREDPLLAESTLTIRATNPGDWGNDLDVAIVDSTVDPGNEFRLLVNYRGEVVEVFDDLSMDPTNANFVANVIGGRSHYIDVATVPGAKTSAPGVLLGGALDPEVSVTLPAQFKVRLTPVPGEPSPNESDVTVDGHEGDIIRGAEALAALVQGGIRKTAQGLGDDAPLKRLYANAECSPLEYGEQTRLMICSGTEGKDARSLVITPGSDHDVAHTLKLTEDDGAQHTDGKSVYLATSVSGNEPERTLTQVQSKLVIDIDGDGPQEIGLEPPYNTGVQIAEAIQRAVRDRSHVLPNDPGKKAAYDNFTAEYTDRYRLTFGATAARELIISISANAVSGDDGLRLQLPAGGIKLGVTTPGTIESDHSMANDKQPARNLSDPKKFSKPTLSVVVKGAPDDPNAKDLVIDCELADDLTSGGTIAAAIQQAVRDKAAAPDDAIKNHPYKDDILVSLARFTCEYVAHYKLTVGDIPDGDPRDSSLRVTSAASDDGAALLKLGRANGGTEQDGSALLRPVPSNGAYFHVGDHPLSLLVRAREKGTNGTAPEKLSDQDFIGDAATRLGLHALDTVTDVNLIAIPGRGSKQVVSAGMAYCSNRPLQDCFFIADPPDPAELGPNSRDSARTYVDGLPTKNDYGALYFPWIMAADPIGRGRNPQRLMPPSGFMAGLYARIDAQRGVFKAPAGTEAYLADALDVGVQIGDVDQDFLNPKGINVIRSFPDAGIVAWGTRTLSPDAAWRYIPVRRMAIFLRVSIYRGIQWAVFEPNDESLWSSLRLNIRAFMLTQFRAGAFQGVKPDDAFFVRCDSTTTTQQDIDNGVVNILVGFAPLKPAEFVVLKLSQKVNQPAV